MGCFSLLWLIQLLARLVVVGAGVAILMLLLPIVRGWVGLACGLAMLLIRISVAVIVIIVALWVCSGRVTWSGPWMSMVVP